MAKFEKLSAKELKMLQDLEDKRKRIEKHDKDFFGEVEDRKDEVLELLKISNSSDAHESKYDESKIDEILKSYDCSFDEFVNYVLDEKQLEAYLDSKDSDSVEVGDSDEEEKAEEPVEEKAAEPERRNSWF